MKIGVPKEIKNNEYRIGLAPKSAQALSQQNHEVYVEKNAGLGSGFTNEDYLNAGAKIIQTSQEIFSNCEMIIKVKEPQSIETQQLQPNQILFTYLHLASSQKLTQELIGSRCISIAYETITS